MFTLFNLRKMLRGQRLFIYYNLRYENNPTEILYLKFILLILPFRKFISMPYNLIRIYSS